MFNFLYFFLYEFLNRFMITRLERKKKIITPWLRTKI